MLSPALGVLLFALSKTGMVCRDPTREWAVIRDVQITFPPENCDAWRSRA